MVNQNPNVWLRLIWAFRFFFLILSNAGFASRVAALQQAKVGAQVDTQASQSASPESAKAKTVPNSGAGTATKPDAEPTEMPQATITKASAPTVDPTQPMLQLLGLLQQEARLIDFLQEDVSQYADADIGAAARVVHQGCRKVLQQYVSVAPVRTETEQSRVTVADGFDPAEIRLTGRISGQAPFTGVLMHRGWRVTQVELPTLSSGHNAKILAPAEVEL